MKLIAVSALALLISVPAFAGADGAATYKAKCATCHAANGDGQSPMGKKMSLRGLGSAPVQKQTDAELYKWTAEGKGKMPAYGAKLSKEEITALVAHMRTMAVK
jgi:cytochrome c5